jgi:hypothetical protein
MMSVRASKAQYDHALTEQHLLKKEFYQQRKTLLDKKLRIT